MKRILYSGYLPIADISFWFQITLPPEIDLFIADTPNSRSYKTFLVKNLHMFYIGQCLIVSFKFFSFFVVLFFGQFNGLFRYIKIKIGWDFRYVLCVKHGCKYGVEIPANFNFYGPEKSIKLAKK